eukprot:5874271-Amphidinium_carterae.1
MLLKNLRLKRYSPCQVSTIASFGVRMAAKSSHAKSAEVSVLRSQGNVDVAEDEKLPHENYGTTAREPWHHWQSKCLAERKVESNAFSPLQ